MLIFLYSTQVNLLNPWSVLVSLRYTLKFEKIAKLKNDSNQEIFTHNSSSMPKYFIKSLTFYICIVRKKIKASHN